MSFKEITNNKTLDVTATGVTAALVGMIYAGLKNDANNSITGNLVNKDISTALVSNSWCTVQLKDVDSTNTAYKVITTCKENTTTSARSATIKLNYNSKISPYTITIKQAGKEEAPTPPVEEKDGPFYIVLNLSITADWKPFIATGLQGGGRVPVTYINNSDYAMEMIPYSTNMAVTLPATSNNRKWTWTWYKSSGLKVFDLSHISTILLENDKTLLSTGTIKTQYSDDATPLWIYWINLLLVDELNTRKIYYSSTSFLLNYASNTTDTKEFTITVTT